jgi:UDP-N-acetylmuramoyl-tripeptide--D-alanyl-D-alanine ligase
VVSEDRLSDLPLSALQEMGAACVAVADTTHALGELAAYHRERLSASVVGITGSNGKTSTRRMTAAVVGTRFDTLSTRGNYNNEIGLPITLLLLRPQHQWAVLELGMNHFGEIRRLGKICTPDVGVITNIGPAHLEGVGSIEGVAEAKAELLETIRPGGTVVLNADDARVMALADRSDHPKVTFGFAPEATVRAEKVDTSPEEITFELIAGGDREPVRLRTGAPIMVANALAAAAVGRVLGISLTDISLGLHRYRAKDNRMHRLALPGEIVVLDDTYNANPASMAAAVRTLVETTGPGRKIAVLGDMLELGAAAQQLHEELGTMAAQSGVDLLYTTGAFAETVARGARMAGMTGAVIRTGSKEEICQHLLRQLLEGDRILVKGSRGMQMETVVAALRGRLQEEDEPAPGREPGTNLKR